MKKLCIWIWQMPQHLLGLLFINVFGCQLKHGSWEWWYEATRLFPHHTGLSLGRYRIVRDPTNIILKHEYGHQQQSLCLGPLYLIIIGLPTLVGNIIHLIIKGDWYYKQPWEAWADWLGGVKRCTKISQDLL